VKKPTIAVTYERSTGGVPARITDIVRVKQIDGGIAVRHYVTRPTLRGRRRTRMTTVVPTHRVICIEYRDDEED